jgi:hypothetical protein
MGDFKLLRRARARQPEAELCELSPEEVMDTVCPRPEPEAVESAHPCDHAAPELHQALDSGRIAVWCPRCRSLVGEALGFGALLVEPVSLGLEEVA